MRGGATRANGRKALDLDPSIERERKRLQQAVAVLALIPILAGLGGVLLGPSMVETGAFGVSSQSHYRYLSGLLFGIGLCFWSVIPDIEHKTGRARLLTLIVFIGGLGRLLGLMITGIPSLTMIGGLIMELIVTPALCAWQWRVAGRCAEARALPYPTAEAAPIDAPPEAFDPIQGPDPQEPWDSDRLGPR